MEPYRHTPLYRCVRCLHEGRGERAEVDVSSPMTAQKRRRLSERSYWLISFYIVFFFSLLLITHNTHTPLSMCSMCFCQRLSDVLEPTRFCVVSQSVYRVVQTIYRQFSPSQGGRPRVNVCLLRSAASWNTSIEGCVGSTAGEPG